MAARHENLLFAVCQEGRHRDCPELILTGQGGDLIYNHCTCTCGHLNKEAAQEKLFAAMLEERSH